MATLKLKKTTTTTRRGDRPPLRGAGPRPRPTLTEAQAERAERARERAQGERSEREPPRRDPRSPAPATGTRNGTPPATGARSGAPRPATPARPAAQRRPRPQPPDAAREGVRLSKRLSELGLASRREADEWIARGWVRVDGRIVDTLGARVLPQQQVSVAPEAGREQAERVTVLLHKPLGYVSGQAEDGHEPAIVLVTAANHWRSDPSPRQWSPGQRHHLAPAGRLDLDSSGLLVLTQDGRIARQLIGDDSTIEKEYLVRVRCIDAALAAAGAPMEVLPPAALERLRHGLELDGVALQPAKVSWQSEAQLRIVLREGRKRQIRRMCELVGLHVTALQRVRIGRIALGALPPGQWRYLGPFERF